jgi:hypothetical protein
MTTPPSPDPKLPGVPAPRPWWKRKWGIAGIIFGVLLVVGGISNAMTPAAGAPPSPSPRSVGLASPGPMAAAPSATATAEPVPSTAGLAATPTPEPTVAPTDPPAATPTPKPTATPVPTILKTAGRGDKVVKFAAQDGPTYARITAKGSGNFAVISYEGSSYGDLLVNEIGSYAGSVYIEPAINRLKISASGSWTVEIHPIEAAGEWGGTTALAGKGDRVVILSNAASGITTIKNKSASNFAIVAYSMDGDYLDLLVNEIGSYSGEVLLPDSDPMVLAIHDVGGSWSMSPVSQ